MTQLYEHQKKALSKMKNGCILNGGVGSGKSRTALAYYCLCDVDRDLYIITTARKRDTKEWEAECKIFGLTATIDSWNNIKKYIDVAGAFFIFDEDRVTGSGEWSKTFIKLSRKNDWIILSATPGDTWMDYIPVFIANGFYRNKTDFIRQHVIYKRFVKFPLVDHYINEGKLLKFRKEILIEMDYKKKTTHENIDIFCDYDKEKYRTLLKDRWNVYKDEPVINAGELCYCLRRVVNENEDRQVKLLELLEDHKKAIIFYNFDYELEILKEVCNGVKDVSVAEWNGHKHQDIPSVGPDGRWCYLVQYTSGCEGWNCTETDTIIFYSMNYSYKVMTQAAGRIDRLNTPFEILYFYHLKSKSGIDLAINRALKKKEDFNAREFAGFR